MLRLWGTLMTLESPDGCSAPQAEHFGQSFVETHLLQARRATCNAALLILPWIWLFREWRLPEASIGSFILQNPIYKWM